MNTVDVDSDVDKLLQQLIGMGLHYSPQLDPYGYVLRNMIQLSYIEAQKTLSTKPSKEIVTDIIDQNIKTLTTEHMDIDSIICMLVRTKVYQKYVDSC